MLPPNFTTDKDTNYLFLLQDAIAEEDMDDFRVLLQHLSNEDDFRSSLVIVQALFSSDEEDGKEIKVDDILPYWSEALKFKPEWGRVTNPKYGNPFFNWICSFPDEALLDKYLEFVNPSTEEEDESMYHALFEEQYKSLLESQEVDADKAFIGVKTGPFEDSVLMSEMQYEELRAAIKNYNYILRRHKFLDALRKRMGITSYMFVNTE